MYQDRGPPRGGTRGGRDQFSWDNVKSSRDRDYYLGHSEKALTGRWQKGRDVYWYTRDVERGEADAASELAAVKQREADLMMEALGVKPRAPKAELRPAQLDKGEMQKLLQGGEDEGGAAGAAAEADRIKGLGFHASLTTGAIQAGGDHETLAGVGGAPGPGATQHQQQAEAQQRGRPQLGQAPSAGGAALTAEQIAEAKRLKRKQEKKAAKRAKKEAKKAKKKAKKERSGWRRSRSSSSGSGSSSDSDGGGRVAAARQFLAAQGLGVAPSEARERGRSPAERRGDRSAEPRRDRGRQRSRSRSPARRRW